jgi:hypothetical protein
MRKHIAKALQARSKAIKTAIERYNELAEGLGKPRLTWEQVVEYTFLSDFDILRDPSNDLAAKPWARPVFRELMDRYFKIQGARGEIKRLNVEIPRVVTWIRDEDSFLRAVETALRNPEEKSSAQLEMDTLVAAHVKLYRERWSQFSDTHLRRFKTLAKKPGFTGSISPGVAQEKRPEVSRTSVWAQQAEQAMDVEDDRGSSSTQWPEDEEDDRSYTLWPEEDDSDDEGDESQDHKIADVLYDISMLSIDGHRQMGSSLYDDIM